MLSGGFVCADFLQVTIIPLGEGESEARVVVNKSGTKICVEVVVGADNGPG